MKTVVRSKLRARYSVGRSLANAVKLGICGVIGTIAAAYVATPLALVVGFVGIPVFIALGLSTKVGRCPSCDEELELLSTDTGTCPSCKAKVFTTRDGYLAARC